MYAVRRTSAALLAAVVLALVPGTSVGLAASAGLAASPASSTAAGLGADGTPGPAIEETLSVPVGPEPDGTAVALDVTVFRPGGLGQHSEPWSAVLLAHGFGGSKADLVERGRDLASRGYLVLGYSARGFGASGGRIHLNDPAYEIADARALVSLLATRSDVLLDAPGDPHVGVVGASYGGALAIMLGATDQRVDSVVGVVAWNDLADAFFPQFAVVGPRSPLGPAQVDRSPEPGPLKALWASRFFGSALASAGSPGAGVGAGAHPSSGGGAGAVCGRFDPTVCRLFLEATVTGRPSPELLTVLRAHSPRPLLAGLRAPTMLVQGMADSLFGIEQAAATARAIAVQVPRLAIRWIDGGHDGLSSTAAADEQALRDWLADTLRGTTLLAGAGQFSYAAPIPRRRTVAPLFTTPDSPPTATWTAVPLAPLVGASGGATSDPQRIVTPPGGQPASVTAIPSLGGLGVGAAAYQLAALPGQSAAFDSPPFAQQTAIVGAPRLTLTVTSTGPETVLFLSLWQVTAGQATLPRRLVAPVRVLTTPGQPTSVDVALAPATWTVEAGSSLRVLITSTDSAYAAPREARVDLVAVAGGELRLPHVDGYLLAAESDLDTESVGVGAAIALLLAAFGVLAWRERRRRRLLPDRDDLADVPLAVEHLVKTYADGHRAVGDVSWRAERGQVVGLLGPNGAGKTTTLRMAMGLITPDSGAVYLGGRAVRPGAPALRGVGALVEGPGFLPHLTGRANLHAYWAATGRPIEEARLDEALDVAALGGAVDRPVRSYSHGMRQRLGIAQAMLGLPDLLVLDEPTNGLDPPQIAAMRPILQRYAAAGRTVVVSSHLLAEVEQTCSHVVVMHAGRVVTAGPVADLIDSSDTTVVHLDPAATAETIAAVADRLLSVAGILEVEIVEDEGDSRLVVTAGMPRPDVVRALTEVGADVVGLSSRKHLEEVFLRVIAAAQTAGEPTGSVTERLRQVRAR
ncbi:MAG TPA: alpha/beta fold hydrolase [Dermatophilaceae bacterium]|nr:alpha/beta fold hydrolase [Dermatophilaceae bacterium]